MAVHGVAKAPSQVATFGTELEPTVASRATVIVPGTWPRLLGRCQRCYGRANRGLSRMVRAADSAQNVPSPTSSSARLTPTRSHASWWKKRSRPRTTSAAPLAMRMSW